jgi:metal-sulfur cluster biosynthetic enzyme
MTMDKAKDTNLPTLIWQAESTHPDLIEPFKNAMREVVDPEIGLNIIELGLVRDLKIENDNAQVTMILTTPFCPYGPAMLEVTRQKAETALKLPTTIEMGMEMWDFSMMEEGAGADWGIY